MTQESVQEVTRMDGYKKDGVLVVPGEGANSVEPAVMVYGA